MATAWLKVNTIRRAEVLVYIQNNPGITKAKLAEQMQLSEGYIGRLLAWLYRDGKIMYTASPRQYTAKYPLT